jgi:hypothetical protein
MKFYLDTEFNSFGGELISLALVPAPDGIPPFYTEIKLGHEAIHPWVRENVLPNLLNEAHSPLVAGMDMARYLRSFGGDRAEIVANWHEDFIHFLKLLLIGAGNAHTTPELTLQLVACKVEDSKIPHNALADARAMRFQLETGDDDEQQLEHDDRE